MHACGVEKPVYAGNTLECMLCSVIPVMKEMYFPASEIILGFLVDASDPLAHLRVGLSRYGVFSVS